MNFYKSRLLYVMYVLSYYMSIAVISRKAKEESFTINVDKELLPALRLMERRARSGTLFDDLCEKKRMLFSVIVINAVDENKTKEERRSEYEREYVKEIKRYIAVNTHRMHENSILEISIKKLDESIAISIGKNSSDLIFVSNRENKEKMYPDDSFADDFYWKYIEEDVFPNKRKAMLELRVPARKVKELLSLPNIKQAIIDGNEIVSDEILQKYYKNARTGDINTIKSIAPSIAKTLHKPPAISTDSEPVVIPSYILNEVNK